MTLDQLKKLVALANNNPNEHEANSAARRVCTILAETNFTLVPEKSKADAIYENLAKQKAAAAEREAAQWTSNLSDIFRRDGRPTAQQEQGYQTYKGNQQTSQQKPSDPSYWIPSYGSWYKEYAIENDLMYFRCYQCKNVSYYPRQTNLTDAVCRSCDYRV